MKPPPLSARTRASIEPVLQYLPDGGLATVVIIKQGFVVDRRGRVERVDAARVRLVDEPWDDAVDKKKSTKYPSDVCLFKPGTDVIVVGAARAPGDRPAPEIDVSVRVGPVEKHLRVFGTRVWYKRLFNAVLAPPRPIVSLPLRWEYAFGGMDASDPKRVAHEPRNPIGRGMAATPEALIDTEGPQIEDPRSLIESHRSRPAPAGVGPIAPDFAPRIGYAGTMDDRWEKERMPLRPTDFDDRHNQVAPPSLVTPTHLRGAEPVRLVGLDPEGPVEFALPRVAFAVVSRADGRANLEHRVALDTVLIEPGTRGLELTYRAVVPMTRPARALRAIQVYEKEFLA